MNVKREEECYDASTDDEGGEPIGRSMLEPVAVKKEEDVDTDDEILGATEEGPAAQSNSSELRAKGKGKPRRAIKSFEERLEDLKAYKAVHGHTYVKKSEDKSLAKFCGGIRYARRNPESCKGRTLTKDRIVSLKALGFDWTVQNKRVKSFQERVEELTAYKAKHGHINVKPREDGGLYQFCCDMRYARRNPESCKGRKLTADRIATLNAIGFVDGSETNALGSTAAHKTSSGWGKCKGKQRREIRTFEERIDELRVYKAEHGHLNMKRKEDKRLYQFCWNIRQARKGQGNMKLTEDRIASLDALGFEWEPRRGGKQNADAFAKRLAELTAYKAEHGHLNVKHSEDKSLYLFCSNIRSARRNPGRRGAMKLTEDRVASLDAIGFDWEPQKTSFESFEKRLKELNAYKEKHGHVSVKESEDKVLADFCVHIREVRRGTGTMKLTEEHIACVDALGFDWEPLHRARKKAKSFQERVQELKAHKAKHGHLNVKKSEDKGLASFCNNIRYARRHPEKRKLTEEDITCLDVLGFDWRPHASTS